MERAAIEEQLDSALLTDKGAQRLLAFVSVVFRWVWMCCTVQADRQGCTALAVFHSVSGWMRRAMKAATPTSKAAEDSAALKHEQSAPFANNGPACAPVLPLACPAFMCAETEDANYCKPPDPAALTTPCRTPHLPVLPLPSCPAPEMEAYRTNYAKQPDPEHPAYQERRQQRQQQTAAA